MYGRLASTHFRFSQSNGGGPSSSAPHAASSHASALSARPRSDARRSRSGAGRFAITAQDEQPPYKYVTAEGDVTDIDTATEAEVRKIAARYLGEEAGGQFTDQNLTPTSIVIRMRPQKWLSTDYSKE